MSLTACLFDPEAILAAAAASPASAYAKWLASLPREDQFTSAAALAELYRAAGATRNPQVHVRTIEERILPAITVLPFDAAVARVFALLRLRDAGGGRSLSDTDAATAATALYHGLELVTPAPERYGAITQLKIRPVSADSGR